MLLKCSRHQTEACYSNCPCNQSIRCDSSCSFYQTEACYTSCSCNQSIPCYSNVHVIRQKHPTQVVPVTSLCHVTQVFMSSDRSILLRLLVWLFMLKEGNMLLQLFMLLVLYMLPSCSCYQTETYNSWCSYCQTGICYFSRVIRQ
jgi:hypothetical protein